jgi:hypothetical protein
MPLACVCELRHITLPRIDLQRHFLPRLGPVANDGSFFEKRRRRAALASPTLALIGRHITARGNRTHRRPGDRPFKIW